MYNFRLMSVFRVGVTRSFYTDAKGRFEAALEQKLAGVDGLEWSAMPTDLVGDYDAIFALSLTLGAEELAGVERTAVVARWGVGYDTIDTDALTEADIALAITPNAVRRPVAEGALALIFAAAKNLRVQDKAVREGRWRGGLPRMGVCLGGRTLGSVGLGNIGKEMFRLASALGFARFLACDPYAGPEEAKALGVELVDLDTLFAESDFVTVNTLLNKETRGLVGEAQFARMKPSAFFVNTSRGPIVDEAALIRALKEERIAGAGIDVFEQEPVDKDNPLLAMDNVMLAPHAVAWTDEIVRDNGLEACDNILAVFRGEAPPGIVNRAVLERPGFQRKLERYREAAGVG